MVFIDYQVIRLSENLDTEPGHCVQVLLPLIFYLAEVGREDSFGTALDSTATRQAPNSPKQAVQRRKPGFQPQLQNCVVT